MIYFSGNNWGNSQTNNDFHNPLFPPKSMFGLSNWFDMFNVQNNNYSVYPILSA